LPSIPDQLESTASSEGLVTRSGSSPPDIDKASDATPTVETETTSAVQLPTRSRAEPKMPAGAGVAFYRESKSSPSVNFTVCSELEDVQPSEASETPLPAEEPAPISQVLDVSQGNEVSGPSPLPAPRTKTESKSSDGSVSGLTMLPRCNLAELVLASPIHL
jgi:serine/arginine repetitive matrix protein 2